MITCTFEDGGTAKLRHVVVDGLVFNQKGEVLLVKRTAKLLEGGKWGVVGGFMERDETIVKALEREIFEETGWKVTNINLLTVNDNPNRPNEDRQNISFVYFCQATEQTGTPDWESDDQQWFPLSALPPKEQIAFDHADNIELYQKYLREKLTLPILTR
jgi:8-oxo-dGTP diphosphatase